MPNATPAPAGFPAQNGAGSPNSWGVITPASSAPNPGAASANAWGVVLPSAKTPAPAISVKPIDTSTAFTKFAGINNFSVPTPTTSTQTSTPAVTQPQLQIKDNSIPGVVQNTLKGLPDAAKTVSDNLINKPITAAGNLLSNTGFVKSIANSANNNGVAANTTIGILQKLSLGTQGLSGLTGGAIQPENFDPDKDNLLDKGLSILANGIGFGAGIGALGEIGTTKLLAGSTYAGGSRAAVQGLTDLAQKFPLVGKYMAPLVQPLLSMAAGSAVESQLNPQLANDTKARAKSFGTAIATAPLYAAMGLLKNPAVGLGGSFLLGYGMTKLSGGSNTEAVTSGLAFSLLDGFGRAGGTRGEAEGQLNDAALSVLNHYAPEGVTLTANSTPDEIHAAFNNAVHQASPKLGGNAQELEAVKNAYDLLSKGGVSNTKGKTAPEVSVDTLHNETKAAIAKAGPLGATEAMKENLGVSHETAERIVKAAQTVQSPKESKDMIAADIAQKLGSRTDEEVTTQTRSHVDKNIDSLTDAYIKKFGNEVGTDEAKELVPGYSDDRSIGNLVQDSAAKIAQSSYDKLVDEDKNNTNRVLISAGGTGAGKSSLLRSGAFNKEDYAAIRDSNMNNSDAAIKRIDTALNKGKDVDVAFVYAPVREAYNRALSRTESMTQELGSGRPVAAQGHIETHYGSYDTMERLLDHYKDNPRVQIHVFDNSGTEISKVRDPLAFIKDLIYNKEDEEQLHKDLNNQRIAAHREGGISSKTNAAYERAEKAQPFSGKRSNTDEQKPQEQNNAEGLLGSSKKDELKSSKIGKSIEAKAIEAGLTKGFPETAGYDPTTFKEQAEKAAELFDSGIDNARAVIRGDEPLPEGLKGEAVIAAAEEYLIENPNAEMAEELANSPLVTANSESAQALVLSKMRTPDSATAKLQQLKQKLIEAAGGKDKIAKARAKAKAAVNKVLLPKEDLQWNSFIDSITC